MRDCKRCRGEVSWTHDTIILVGEYRVHLCNDCINAFTKSFFAAPLNARRDSNFSQGRHFDSLAKAGQPVDEAAWQLWGSENNAINAECFAFADAFCQPLPVTDEERQKTRESLTAAGFSNVTDA